jgi:hypothetical protein
MYDVYIHKLIVCAQHLSAAYVRLRLRTLLVITLECTTLRDRPDRRHQSRRTA